MIKTETKEEFNLEITSRNFTSTRNACKLCAPLGASIAFRGIEGCIPLIHGSQGCSTYIRRYVISHFKEPIDIASSNFSEQSAIFGGGDNLKTAIDNLRRQYQPAAIGISTTCLSETIGDDVELYIDQYRKSNKDESLPVIIHASTPSYRGTHLEGFQEALRATVETLARGGPHTDRLNLIPGFLSAEDLRHLKEILSDFGIGHTLLPDYSETLDGESWEEYQKLSAGGTTIEAIRAMGRAQATIQFGKSLKGLNTAATFLEGKFGVQSLTLGIPVGIRETDLFFKALKEWSGLEIPQKYQQERGRLVDAYIDGHKYVYGKRAIIYGEADFVAALASWLDEIGIVPALCATGACTGKFKETVLSGLKNCPEEPLICEDTDFADMLDTCRTMGIDMVMGSSKGYFISRKLGVPLVRVGFPIHDRIGGQRILHVGYRGTQQLFDRVVNALIEAGQERSAVGYSYI
ncbi:MAG: nitrogenase [Deltaproteobacteria bacterium]|nr:nitrogenase [Deltaproteobacteria bacterium]